MNPEHYDMVLNTAGIPIDVCVEQILQLTALPNFQQTDRSRRALIDKLIEFRIRGRLDGLSDNKRLADLQISVDAGMVSLRGIAADSEIVHMIVRTAWQTEGVMDVDDQMRTPVASIGPVAFVPMAPYRKD